MGIARDRDEFGGRSCRDRYGDSAAVQRSDADVAVRLDRERVEALVHRRPIDETAAVRRLGDAVAGFASSPGPFRSHAHRRRFGLGDVQRLAVGRQADAVRLVDRKDHLANQRAVDLRVADAAAIPVAMARLAGIGETEAAMRVHDEVVRTADVAVVDLVVEHLEFAGLDVHAFDAAGDVIVGRTRWSPSGRRRAA